MSGIVSVSVVLDTQRKLNNDEYPVKLRVIHERKNRLFSLGSNSRISYTKDDFSKIMTSNRKNYKLERVKLSKYEEKAQSIIDNLIPFTFEEFKRKYRQRTDVFSNLYDVFQHHVSQLYANGQLSTAVTYESASKSIKGFHKGKTLPFHLITSRFLTEFQEYLIKKGKSLTTVSIYVRCIRKLFNMAIDSGEVGKSLYPFGKKVKGRYEIPEHKNIKKALSKADIKKLFEYEAIGEAEQFHLDMWLFSYLCNGANMADVFRLRYKNISGSEIKFTRKKTSHNSRVQEIAASITPDVERILNAWGKSSHKPNDYIFSILTPGLTAEQELAKIKQVTKQINKYIRRIAMAAGIESDITTYTARHTYTTILVQSGLNIEFIKDQLGHSNSQTTQNYIASFDSDSRMKAAQQLTKWT